MWKELVPAFEDVFHDEAWPQNYTGLLARLGAPTDVSMYRCAVAVRWVSWGHCTARSGVNVPMCRCIVAAPRRQSDAVQASADVLWLHLGVIVTLCKPVLIVMML